MLVASRGAKWVNAAQFASVLPSQVPLPASKAIDDLVLVADSSLHPAARHSPEESAIPSQADSSPAMQPAGDSSASKQHPDSQGPTSQAPNSTKDSSKDADSRPVQPHAGKPARQKSLQSKPSGSGATPGDAVIAQDAAEPRYRPGAARARPPAAGESPRLQGADAFEIHMLGPIGETTQMQLKGASDDDITPGCTLLCGNFQRISFCSGASTQCLNSTPGGGHETECTGVFLQGASQPGSESSWRGCGTTYSCQRLELVASASETAPSWHT